MYSKPKTGDLLHCIKGYFEHVGVYIGNNQVFHNIPGGDAVITNYEEFSKGGIVKVTSFNDINQEQLTKRLKEIIAKDRRYNFLFNNCEHVANYLILGRRKSPQVQAGIAGAMIGILIGKKLKNDNWIYHAALGGITGLVFANLYKSYDYSIPAR